MSVTVKSQREIELMREAGKILGTVLNELEKECKPGVTTYHINKIGEEMIKATDVFLHLRDIRGIQPQYVYQLMTR